MSMHKKLDAVHLYSVFGLLVQSDIACPELIEYTNSIIQQVEPDVTIRLAKKVPASLGDNAYKGVRYEALPGQLLLHVDGVASFLVNDGKEILIQLSNNANEDAVRLFLLGSAFGALLHMRGVLAMHGSCVCTEDGAFAIVGKSGAGKSTLARALIHRGFQVLTDDICAITFDGNNRPFVMPAYPQLKLWADSLEIFDIDINTLRRVRPELEKHALRTREYFCHQRVPLKKIYLLSSVQKEEAVIAPIESQIACFKTLRRHTYRERFLEGLQAQLAHFSQLSELSQTLPCAYIQRSKNLNLLGDLVNKLVMDIQQ